MTEQPVILSVSGLSISFGDTELFTAVRNSNFALRRGETLAIVGESGSGKSLTALAMMGLLPKATHIRGTINFAPQDATKRDLAKLKQREWQAIRGKDIAMVFQEPMSSLNPVMKVGEQLRECILEHQSLSRSEAKLLAIEWMAKTQLPNPEAMYNRYPHQLSGGQKQRLMIAMAMCNKPSLLIADEPTTALDVTVQKEIVSLMAELQREFQTAIIFITHDLGLAAEIADKVLVMYRGEVVEHGAAKQVLQYPKQPYTQALIECKPNPEQKGKPLPTVAERLGAETVRQPTTAAHKYESMSTPILEVKDLEVWFAEQRNMLGKAISHFKAVNKVSFSLHEGETLGLVGESGCGKSTISRSLMGLVPVHEGHIYFKGKDLAQMSAMEWNDVRKDIQLVFQDPFASLNPRMKVGDILKESVLRHRVVPAKQANNEVLRLLDMVHLSADAAKRYPHQFSGGQRQRIGIARALSVRPELLICDESVSALDVSVQAQILNLLKELQQKLGLSYLFISHDLSVVYYMSDNVMVMQQGIIVEKGNATDVLKHPSHPYTQKLINAIPEL